MHSWSTLYRSFDTRLRRGRLHPGFLFFEPSGAAATLAGLRSAFAHWLSGIQSVFLRLSRPRSLLRWHDSCLSHAAMPLDKDGNHMQSVEQQRRSIKQFDAGLVA